MFQTIIKCIIKNLKSSINVYNSVIPIPHL